ncbi:D-2-hydroxyacid dehydrogenase [Rhodovulum sp. DZ06]|uniref:D-2-hydroxyacid dehydrogenase n=1 Tax=Rhodovulum sp. DZ06 TaxID=3425126 RepID=UPI003D35006E
MTDAPRIVFLDRETFAPAVELTAPAAPHAWEAHQRTAPEEVAARLAGARVAITNKVPLRRAVLEGLPELKFISVAATGYDCVDIAACRELGIQVSNVRGYAKHTVPEHVFALILGLRRAIVQYRADVIAGRWEDAGQFCFHDHPIRDLAGSRIAIFGGGAIGSAVARIAEGFGMEPVFVARKREAPGAGRIPFEAALETADILSLHCPLTPATQDMIAAPEFARMGRRPLLINTARGGLVNGADAVAALEGGLIGGLGIDVLPVEPPTDDPIRAAAARPDVILTPHVGWASEEAQEEVWRQTVEAVDAFLAGAPVRLLT